MTSIPQNEFVFLYGPPGSGKSSAGRTLAQALEQPFWDLDQEIERCTHRSIPEIFSKHGEAGFRKRERAVLKSLLTRRQGVISLGGGALLNPVNRELAAQHGQVVCLQAGLVTLLERLGAAEEERPLLHGDLEERLSLLLEERAEHYNSFPAQVSVDGCSPQEAAAEIQRRLGLFRVSGMGRPYDVRVESGGLDRLGVAMQLRGLNGPVVLVSDERVAALYAGQALAGLQAAGYPATLVTFPSGEEHKSLATAESLWAKFLAAGLERGGTLVALGGGVTGDLAGFAAAVYLRGVNWVNVPTTLLAMIDASLGGKTGVDLPAGKNLLGAFHPPRLVLADPGALATLPDAELRSGLAELVKHGILADPDLFAACAQGWQAVKARIAALVAPGMAVKIRVIIEDPYERGRRAALNLGHTLGHAVESASRFRLRHGEAVAIGMVAAARLAARQGLAEPGLVVEIARVLTALGLPTRIPPGLDRDTILQAVKVDKKRANAQTRWVLPRALGDVLTGVVVPGWEEIIFEESV